MRIFGEIQNDKMTPKPNNSYSRCSKCGIRRHISELMKYKGSHYCKVNGNKHTPSCYMSIFLKDLKSKRKPSKSLQETKELETYIQMNKPIKSAEQKVLFRKMSKEGFTDAQIIEYLSQVEKEVMEAHEVEKQRFKKDNLTFKEEFDKLKQRKHEQTKDR